MQKNFFIYLFGLLALTACESYDVKSTLGLKKPAPDEFMVISNPPLSAPPEFRLQQPSTNSELPQSNYVFEPETNTKSPSNLTTEDSNFLQEFNKPHAKSSVQKTVDEELNHNKKAKSERGIIRKTVSKLNEDNDPTINPVVEKERIKTNAEQGKPINEGTVKMQSKSTLERIFN